MKDREPSARPASPTSLPYKQLLAAVETRCKYTRHNDKLRGLLLCEVAEVCRLIREAAQGEQR